MKYFECEYIWNGWYNTFEHIICIVYCETMEVALGLCLEQYPQTNNDKWYIEELKLKYYEVHQLHHEEK